MRAGTGNEAESEALLRKQESVVGIWRMRMNRNLESESPDSFIDLLQHKGRALRQLTYNPGEQRKLIFAARTAGEIIESLDGKDDPDSLRLKARAERVDEDARSMFILCHRGFVERLISKHVQRFDSESPETARDILHQACDIALHRTIDRYDFDNPANPLTYATRVMQDELKREAEAGRRVRLKSKANLLGDKIERMAKEIENEGRQVSVAELADRLDETPERIAEILPHARRHTVRLDAPAQAAEATTTIGALIEDPLQAIEDPIVEEDTRQRLYSAMGDLTPFERKAVEVAFGLGDNETVEQKDLFDGVYLDDQGRAYSAKASVVSERAKRGEQVIKKAQRELNDLCKQGDLSFQPGNPEAHALARAAKGEIGDGERTDRLLTYETGIPPTSGKVQDALKRGLDKLSRHQNLQGLEARYRGQDELENSETARKIVRSKLSELGAVSADQLASLRSTRSPSGGKSKLRVLAEKHGLVDPDTGRLTI